MRRELRSQRFGKKADEAIALALKAVAGLDLPHLAIDDESGEVVH